MSNPGSATPRLAPMLAVILVILALLTSCSEDTPTDCVLYDVGAVEGLVLSAGDGIATRVGARFWEGPNQGQLAATTWSDDSGWYRLELPGGFYRLELDPEEHTVIYSSDMRDTVRVRRGEQRVDLRRGRAEVRIALPAELERRTFDLRLDTPASFDDASSEEIAAGGAVTFTFSTLYPGSYSMRLRVVGSSARLYLPDALDEDGGDLLLVDTEGLATYDADYSESYASISGHVTGSWQQPGSRSMRVTAFAEEGDGIAEVDCDLADGAFTLDLLVPRPVRLRHGINGLDRWYGGDSFATAEVFQLEPGDRITGVTVVESGFTVWLEGPGHWTAHSATVHVRDEAGWEFTPSSRQGSPITVSNLAPGRYYLQVDSHCDDQPWQSQWYAGVLSLAEATPIDLAPGQMQEIAFPLLAGGRIAGRVRDASGGWPPPIHCVLYDLAGEPYCDASQYTNDGFFDYPGLPDGDYYLGVQFSNNDFWWYPGTANIIEGTVLHIEEHAQIVDLIWSLPAEEVQP